MLPGHMVCSKCAPLIPTDKAPVATAWRAYSICTSLPDGLEMESEKQKRIASTMSKFTLLLPERCQTEAISF